METQERNYVKWIATILLIGSITLVIYLASDILIPLVLAFLFAVLVRPIDRFFQSKWRFPQVLSILVTLVLVLSITTSIIALMVVQIKGFVTDLPDIQAALEQQIEAINRWSVREFGFKILVLSNLNFGAISGQSLEMVSSLTNGLMYFLLMPIYAFFLLLYRSLLLTFLLKIVPQKNSIELQTVVNDVKSIIRNYIVGLFLEVVVVTILMGIGLYCIGVKYVVFLALLTGLLNLIPYIGIIIAFAITAVLTLLNAQHLDIILWIFVVFALVQFIDNNILLPKIVGSKVSVNALASMVSVIIGGALAGIPGMFLAIPLIAILKVVFDHVPALHAYGYLLGDDIPRSFNWMKARLTRKQEEKKDA